MSEQRPIATHGIFGQVSRNVVDSWNRSAQSAERAAQSVRAFEMALRDPVVVSRALCEMVEAELVTANKWQYTGKIFYPAPLSGSGITVGVDLTFSYSTIRNLREWFNTASKVDGMDTTGLSFGPVGSSWDAGASEWITEALEAIVEVVVYRDRAGNAYPTIDRPNPLRCEE